VSGLVTAGSATITGAATVGTTLGVTGVSTLASAVVTGDLTVRTDKLLVTSSGVGFGVNPNYPLDVLSTGLIAQFLRDLAVDTGIQIQADNSGAIIRVVGNQALRLNVNGVDAVTLNSTGNLVLAGGTAAANGVGVTFPAVQVASSDANCLDDYEEGTWTPVVADASTGGNVGTCANNGSTYTKIGRQVSVQCYISVINTTGMTGANFFRIRGLPFATVKGGNGNFYTYRVGRNALTASSSAFASDGGSSIYFPNFTVSSATADLAILVSDITSGTSEFIVSVTYSV
jgi:hypothetical protein